MILIKTKKQCWFWFQSWICAVLLMTPLLHAQIPQLIHYQGRVAVNKVNYDGQGYFKFALVSGDGSTSYWSHDGTSVNGGEPAAYLKLPVQNGLYSILLGDATLPGMSLLATSVFENNDVRLRVWFDDTDTGFQQLVPDQRIAAVGYAMMAAQAQSVATGAVTSAMLADGAVTGEKIANLSVSGSKLTDGAVMQRLLADGFSAVPAGGTILADEPSQELIDAGYVYQGEIQRPGEWSPVAFGEIAVMRSNHVSLWIGNKVFVWGGVDENSNLKDDGYFYNPTTDRWSPIPSSGLLSPRRDALAVWTGEEVLIWGGYIEGGFFGGNNRASDGARFNPETGVWQSISYFNEPVGRLGASAVWTGTEMIIWGGADSGGVLASGARYNPVTGLWSPMTGVNAPSARKDHRAIWTGSEMIVFGGEDNGLFLGDGARYNPTTNQWTTLPIANAPIGRSLHSAVWTGTEMIVWGGTNDGINGIPSGGRYNLALNTWTFLPAGMSNEPSGRFNHTAVWENDQMYLWGGAGNAADFKDDGAYYTPETNTWTTLDADHSLAGRQSHTMLSTGDTFMIWGGSPSSADWGIYEYTSQVWDQRKPFDLSFDSIGGGYWWNGKMLVWGDNLILWGGINAAENQLSNTGYRYDPKTKVWHEFSTISAPLPRIAHGMSIMENELFVFGGSTDVGDPVGSATNDGARYDLVSNTWNPISTANAPSARLNPHVLWNGTEILVFGGSGPNAEFSGGRYNPTTNTWTGSIHPPSSAPLPNSVVGKPGLTSDGLLICTTVDPPQGTVMRVYKYDPRSAVEELVQVGFDYSLTDAALLDSFVIGGKLYAKIISNGLITLKKFYLSGWSTAWISDDNAFYSDDYIFPNDSRIYAKKDGDMYSVGVSDQIMELSPVNGASPLEILSFTTEPGDITYVLGDSVPLNVVGGERLKSLYIFKAPRAQYLYQKP